MGRKILTQEQMLQGKLKGLETHLRRSNFINDGLKIFQQIQEMRVPHQYLWGDNRISFDGRDFVRHVYYCREGGYDYEETVYKGDGLYVLVSVKMDNEQPSTNLLRNLLGMSVQEQSCIGRTCLSLGVGGKRKPPIQGTNLKVPRVKGFDILTYMPGAWENRLHEIAKHDFVKEAAEYVKRGEERRVRRIFSDSYVL